MNLAATGIQIGKQAGKQLVKGCCPASGVACGTPKCPIVQTTNKFTAELPKAGKNTTYANLNAQKLGILRFKKNTLDTLKKKNELTNLLNTSQTNPLYRLIINDISTKPSVIKLKKAIQENNLIELSTLNGTENIIDDINQEEKLELSRLLKININTYTTLTCNEIQRFATNQLMCFKKTIQQLYNQILELNPLNKTILILLKEKLFKQHHHIYHSSPLDPLLIKNEIELYENLINTLDSIRNESNSFSQKLDVYKINGFSIANILLEQHQIQETNIFSIIKKTVENQEKLIVTKNKIEEEINLLFEKLTQLNQILNTNSNDPKIDSENISDTTKEKQESVLKKFNSRLNILNFKSVTAISTEELATHLQTLSVLTKKIEIYTNLTEFYKTQKITLDEYQNLKKSKDEFYNTLNTILVNRTKSLISHLYCNFDNQKDQKIINKFTTIITEAIENKNYQKTEKILKSAKIKFPRDEQINALLGFLLNPFQKLHHTTIT